MGIVLDESLSPVEACKVAFPWHVVQKPLTYRSDGSQYVLDDLMVNVRSDHPEIQLGTVSPNYQIVQPIQMAEFCEALSDVGGVKIETAGSIRKGKRVWFLCKGNSFEIGRGDVIYDYLLISNGFDRSTSFRVTPTTIRVVCSNTLHAAVPSMNSTDLRESAICLRHTENVFDRVEEAKAALQAYGSIQTGMREVIQKLAATPLTREQVEAFFLESYTADFGEVPENPRDRIEENRRNRALQAAALFSKRFDDEYSLVGSTAWNALNAYTDSSSTIARPGAEMMRIGW
jgi:phage/plasmid-like protein (TIGR03299 family)